MEGLRARQRVTADDGQRDGIPPSILVARAPADARQLTSDPAVESQPSVAPDGESVIFAVKGDNRGGLARLDLASGRVTPLTTDPTDSAPQYLPDGRSVVFTRFAPVSSLFRLVLDGGAVTPINRRGYSESLAPDGRHVASFTLEINGRILIGMLPLDGTPPTRGFDIMNAPIIVRWTPRGDALTFHESRKGSPRLWNQPVDGSARLLLDLGGERIFNFAWSHDGRLAVSHGPAPTDVVLMTGIR